MMETTDLYLKKLSDTAILALMGKFVRYHRLQQNKTQSQLALEAGINRTTLVEFEHGKRSNTLTLVQLIRALNLMQVFEVYKIEKKLSPVQLAMLQEPERQRAYAPKTKNQKPISDW